MTVNIQIAFFIAASLILGLVTLIASEIISNNQVSHIFSESNELVSPIPNEMSEVKGIGVLGDSLSDEYQADDARGLSGPNPTYNWVELLVREKQLNFGEWDNFNEPRRSGYAYNWARSSATAQNMIDTGQHTGLAQQIENEEVNFAVIFIGANDFAPYSGDGFPAIYNYQLSDEQVDEKINGVVENISTAVDTLQQAGDVEILLVTIPDWNNQPTIKESFPDDERRERVRQAIDTTNSYLQDMAKDKNIIVSDPNVFYTSIVAENEGPVNINDVLFDLTAENNDASGIYLNDNVHLGTVMNGLFANKILEVINKKFNNEIDKFSFEEIFTIAGLDQ